MAAMGVSISIDDFGMAYSSLAWLDQFPVHTLKIDRQFVSKLQTSPRSYRLVRGPAGLAHSMGLEAVAEGVETGEQRAALAAMDCDIVQGWHHARPMPLAALEAFARCRRPAQVQTELAYADVGTPSTHCR